MKSNPTIRRILMGKKSIIYLWILAFLIPFCLTPGVAEEVPELIFEFPTAEGNEYIQGTEDIIRSTPEAIFGTADFEKMRDLRTNSQDYQLGRKVALLFTAIEPGSPFGFICTGFLVGPDLLMTNHHCTHDDFGRPYPLERMAIYMDYYQEPDVDPTRGGVTAGVTAIVSADAPLDYALLRLDKPIGNTYGWLELDATTPVTPGQSVKIIHHSQGRSKEISRRNSQIVEVPQEIADRYPFLFGYLADTQGGSSGAPVFLRDGTGVIGINHSSWGNRDGPIFNGGSLMSWIVPEIEQYLPQGPAPDLVVESARVDNEFLRPGESFTLSVTVRNQGTTSSPTTLQYYYSTDNTISIDDAPMGTATVGSLPPGGTIEKSITLTAPDYAGTYYYGACVDPAPNENATYNNCSAAAPLTVSNTPPFWIYWRSSQGIQRAANDGTNRQLLVNARAGRLSGIALDVEGGKMYWTLWLGLNMSKIQRANLDGSNVEDVITGLPEPTAIALDTAGEKMYWTDTWRSRIQRANLDGSNVEDIVIDGLNSPHGIALDVAAGKIYWTNYGEDLIQRANLDGSNVEDLVSGLHIPMGIALDVAAGKIYWVDQGRDNRGGDMNIGKIQRANLNGSNLEDLVQGLWSPYSIALDVEGGKMYWTDYSTDKIQRANLDGSNVEDLITEINPFGGIALGISQPSGPGPGPAPEPDPLDVNGDGRVTAMDLVAVALFYGTQVPVGISLPADVNADGIVNILDLTAVAQGIDAAGAGSNGLSLEEVEAALLTAIEQAADIEAIAEAPMGGGILRDTRANDIAYSNVADALADARHLATSDARLGKGIPAVLEELLQLLAEMRAIPETTTLLPNYPNPFNPETWIPYHLATDAAVVLTIYDVRGGVVRTLTLGHQAAGMYESRARAAYWDGRNESGEPVASGLYFYTLTAGDFSATRKMLIRK